MKKGLRQGIITTSVSRVIIVPNLDLMKKGLRLSLQVSSSSFFLSVPNLDLMKKGLRPDGIGKPPLCCTLSSKPRPDEEGIETSWFLGLAAIMIISVPNLDLMKKGLRPLAKYPCRAVSTAFQT